MQLSAAARLLEWIQVATPTVENISIKSHGDSASVTVSPASEQASAQSAIDSFDWSQAAHDAWLEDQKPERKAIRQAAAQAIADNDAFLALGSPTNAQTLAQVRRLTQQNTRIIRRLIQLD